MNNANIHTSAPDVSWQRASRGVTIRLRHCGKTYRNGTVGLAPVDLSIAGGQIVVLLGPSGCGKTTLLRLIAGLETADCHQTERSAIFFDKVDVTHTPIEKRNVGMVFQSYALFPNMDVTQNIAYGLRVQKTPKPLIARKVREMLEMFSLTDLASRRIHQLSGGQCQRVALARAIITEPDVLLLDEPLSALDALLREKLRVEIHKILVRLGITAVYVTHDQQEAMAIGDRIIVMHDGVIAQDDSPEAIYRSPKTPFVAGFIGRINKLSGLEKNSKNISSLTLPTGNTIALPAQNTSPNIDTREATWIIRPEHITIIEADIKTEPDSVCTGLVSDSIFLGDRTRVFVSGITNKDIIIDCFQQQKYTIGQSVTVRFDIKRFTKIL